MSVPSIPSRFLTPIIDASTADNDDEICKMSRLVDDPRRVGPGSYQLIEDQIKKSPTNTIDWNRSRTIRTSSLIEPQRKTQESVGPGSYTIQGQFYKPQQPFFARDGLKPVKVHHDRGSIRNNLEIFGDDSEDEGEMVRRRTSPGPGAYKTLTSSFLGKEANRPSSIQVFGSTVSRFNQKPIGT